MFHIKIVLWNKNPTVLWQVGVIEGKMKETREHREG
jgi:hypothetical protein